MKTTLNPTERLEKYLKLLGYLCLVFSALQIWEYYSFSSVGVSIEDQLKSPRLYNILFVFMMSALSGMLLIHRPKLGVITFHTLAVVELTILLFLNDYVGGGKNTAAAFFVVGLLFYYKLMAKIKLEKFNSKDQK
jgi:hypothetical protein